MVAVTKPLMVQPGTDEAVLEQVADLIAAAVGRQEALGLAAPLAAADYRAHLDGLMKHAAGGDAGLGVVLDPNGAVLGTAQWTRSGYRTRRVLAELDRVCVQPTARGLGVGRMLVGLLATDAAEHGVEVLGLEVRGNNHGAIAMYERCGFRRTGLIPNAVAVGKDRYDVVLMHRELVRPADVRLIGSEPTGAGSSNRRRHPADRT
jgi:ribosomal protein S18 acetylase RimI-like enzyme